MDDDWGIPSTENDAWRAHLKDVQRRMRAQAPIQDILERRGNGHWGGRTNEGDALMMVNRGLRLNECE